MNSFNAVGRVGRDCEIRFTDGGDPIGSWSLAVNHGYGKNAGTLWVNCSLFGKRAENLKPYILKGSQLGIQGEIFMREYVSKDGATKTSLECRISNVSLIGSSNSTETQEQSASNSTATPTATPSANPMENFEDDIPF